MLAKEEESIHDGSARLFSYGTVYYEGLERWASD
jgi:hypothetical protein